MLARGPNVTSLGGEDCGSPDIEGSSVDARDSSGEEYGSGGEELHDEEGEEVKKSVSMSVSERCVRPRRKEPHRAVVYICSKRFSPGGHE